MRSKEPSIVVLIFFALKVSLAAVKRASLSTSHSIARSKPLRFGTSAEYSIPSERSIRSKTSRASLNCGTHLGETKAVTSIWRVPVLFNAFTKATLASVGTHAFSFEAHPVVQPQRSQSSVASLSFTKSVPWSTSSSAETRLFPQHHREAIQRGIPSSSPPS